MSFMIFLTKELKRSSKDFSKREAELTGHDVMTIQIVGRVYPMKQ